MILDEMTRSVPHPYIYIIKTELIEEATLLRNNNKVFVRAWSKSYFGLGYDAQHLKSLVDDYVEKFVREYEEAYP